MAFVVTSSGDYKDTKRFLNAMRDNTIFGILDSYGARGVDLLSSATPIETGLTAHSWEYAVEHSDGRHILSWNNTHEHNGVNIAVILQYGHGTGTGGYVEGIDYINPALRPLFDKLVEDIWKAVTNA